MSERRMLGFIGDMGLQTSHRFVKEFASLQLGIPLRYELARHHGLDEDKVGGYITQGLYKEEFEAVVVSAALQLVKEGATDIALLCNSAHQHEPELRKALSESGANFISIVDAVKDEVERHNLVRVLLMATSRTNKIGLYDPLTSIVKPSTEGQKIIDTTILKILRNQIGPDDISELANVASSHKKIDGFLFACTDLAVVMDPFKGELVARGEDITILESTQALQNFIIANMLLM